MINTLNPEQVARVERLWKLLEESPRSPSDIVSVRLWDLRYAIETKTGHRFPSTNPVRDPVNHNFTDLPIDWKGFEEKKC